MTWASKAAAGLGLLLGGCYVGWDSQRDAAGGDGSGAEAGTGGEAETEGEPDDEGGDFGDDGFEVSATPMRRLTSAQFVQSTRDLLEIPTWVPESDLPDEGLNQEEFQLPNMVAATVTTTLQDYTQYRELAKEAAGVAFATDADLQARLPCMPDAACVRDYFVDLAERAWGRPVDADDPVLAGLLGVAEEGEMRLGSARLGVQFAVASLLQSPEFLYVYPTPRADDEGAMDDYSLARSLALVFRDSVPDEELLDLARADALHRKEVLEAQVDRLIAEAVEDPTHRGAVMRFFDEWWSTNVIEAIGKDAQAFPEFDEALRTAMRGEIDAWLGNVVFEQSVGVEQLLVGDRVWVNDELAALYGIEGTFGAEHEPVDVGPDSPRAGLLTTGAFLSVMAHPATTSPAARGRFVSERLLCLTIPPPPGTVDTTVPEPVEPETKRDRFARHTTDPTCAGCHAMMDPMGFSLEAFDAIGRWREKETVVFEGQTYELDLDTTGEIGGVAFANAREMSAVIAADPRYAECVTLQFMRHALGRDLEGQEKDVVEELSVHARDEGFLPLMRAVATHALFSAMKEGQ